MTATKSDGDEDFNLRAVFPDENYVESRPSYEPEQHTRPGNTTKSRLPLRFLAKKKRTLVAASLLAASTVSVLPRALHPTSVGGDSEGGAGTSASLSTALSRVRDNFAGILGNREENGGGEGGRRQVKVWLGSDGAKDGAHRQWSPQLPQWPAELWGGGGTAQSPAPPEASPSPAPRQSSSFIAQAARRVMPAVVLIETETYDHGEFPLPGGGSERRDDVFEDEGEGEGDDGDFETDEGEGEEYYFDPSPPPPPPPRKLGQGSGFLYRSDGLVITNAHVVKGASGVRVTMTDGSRHVGTVLGSDPFSDLAVVRIRPEEPSPPPPPQPHHYPQHKQQELKEEEEEGNGLAPFGVARQETSGGEESSGGATAATTTTTPTAATAPAPAAAEVKAGGGGVGGGPKPVKYPVAVLGDSEELQAGDWVIAIGSPFGLENTVTLGVCSSSARHVNRIDQRMDIKGAMIQTDAAINPGNSGGPLINEFGEVVGINTLMRRNANSIGFAVPINRAKDVVNDLVQGKQVTWSFLGITHKTLSPEMAQRWNRDPNSYPGTLPEVWGALVTHVTPSTAAERAGLKRFDVIRQANEKEVRSTNDLVDAVDKCKVGEKLMLQVYRGSRVLEVEARPQDLGQHQRALREKRERQELQERERRELEQRRQQQHRGGESNPPQFPFPFSFPWEDDSRY